jgi:DNA-binding NarL/FixJ family response regulator
VEYDTPRPRPFRILLVAENDDFIDGLMDWFEDDLEIEIVGRAHTGREATERIELFCPNVVLVDAVLPDGSGFELVRTVKDRWPGTVVIMMTFFDRITIRGEALLAGADDCVSKSDVISRLRSLVRFLVPPRDLVASETGDSSRLSGESRSTDDQTVPQGE